MTTHASDTLHDVLLIATQERDKAWSETARWIRDHSDDPEIVARLDRCLTLEHNVRALQRMLAHERGNA